MSTQEIVGLALAAGVVGVGIGLAICLALALRLDRAQVRPGPKADAYARWLGANMTVSRASLSFVAAFRSLADERPDSVYFGLRVEEAQRARSQWCEAMRDLEHAEAVLIACYALEPNDVRLRACRDVGPADLRRAVDGDASEFGKLAIHLRGAERAAVTVVRAATVDQGRSRRGLVGAGLVRALQWLRSVVDSWSRP